jgi:hypothetical protein
MGKVKIHWIVFYSSFADIGRRLPLSGGLITLLQGKTISGPTPYCHFLSTRSPVRGHFLGGAYIDKGGNKWAA